MREFFACLLKLKSAKCSSNDILGKIAFVNKNKRSENFSANKNFTMRLLVVCEERKRFQTTNATFRFCAFCKAIRSSTSSLVIVWFTIFAKNNYS